MNSIRNVILVIVIWGGLYVGLHVLAVNVLDFPRLDGVFFGACFTLCIFSFLYGRAWMKSLLVSRKGLLWVLMCSLITAVIAGYAHFITSRTISIYDNLTADSSPLIGQLHHSDPVYGYRPLAHGRARISMFPGDTLDFFKDADGFRIPSWDTLKQNRPGEVDVMFFGCSFTEGAGCKADSTFPHLVSRTMGLKYINAGVSSWGLSQMYLLAKETLPKYKPRLVVFQYSSWMPERALAVFKWGTEVPMPKPFFEKKDPSGPFTIRTPPYASQIFDLDRHSIRAQYKGRFMAFLLDVGIPFFTREDFLRMRMRWAMLTGELRPVSNDTRNQIELSRQIYAELLDLARANGTTPMILLLPSLTSYSRETDSTVLSNFDRNIVANALDEHEQYMKLHPGTSLGRDFVHWRIINGDSVRVDIHPNNLSHRIIAQSVIRVLQRLDATDSTRK